MKQSSKSNIRVFSVVIYHGFFSGLWLGCRIHLIAEPFLRCICSLSPMLVRYLDGRHMPHWYCYTLSMDYTATLPWEWFILLLFVFFTCFWGIFARRDSRYWMGWLYRNTRTLRLPVLDLLLPFGDGSEYIFVISVESEAIPNNILGEGRGIFVLLDTLDKLDGEPNRIPSCCFSSATISVVTGGDKEERVLLERLGAFSIARSASGRMS